MSNLHCSGVIISSPLRKTLSPVAERDPGGYWNDSTDGNDGDNYNVGNPAYEVQYAKGLSTNTSISETISSINTNVVFSNTATVGDVFDSTFGIIRNPADTATTSQSGTIINQSYVNHTYLSEDYVGDSRTLT